MPMNFYQGLPWQQGQQPQPQPTSLSSSLGGMGPSPMQSMMPSLAAAANQSDGNMPRTAPIMSPPAYRSPSQMPGFAQASGGGAAPFRPRPSAPPPIQNGQPQAGGAGGGSGGVQGLQQMAKMVQQMRQQNQGKGIQAPPMGAVQPFQLSPSSAQPGAMPGQPSGLPQGGSQPMMPADPSQVSPQAAQPAQDPITPLPPAPHVGPAPTPGQSPVPGQPPMPGQPQGMGLLGDDPALMAGQPLKPEAPDVSMMPPTADPMAFDPFKMMGGLLGRMF